MAYSVYLIQSSKLCYLRLINPVLAIEYSLLSILNDYSYNYNAF